jgi:hypothetical protein
VTLSFVYVNGIRGGREQGKAVGHHRLRPGAVGQRAEDRFETTSAPSQIPS